MVWKEFSESPQGRVAAVAPTQLFITVFVLVDYSFTLKELLE